MRRSDHPSRPRARICCCLVSSKTLLMPATELAFRPDVNVSIATGNGRFSAVDQWPVLGVHRGAGSPLARAPSRSGNARRTASSSRSSASRASARFEPVGPAPPVSSRAPVERIFAEIRGKRSLRRVDVDFRCSVADYTGEFAPASRVRTLRGLAQFVAQLALGC